MRWAPFLLFALTAAAAPAQERYPLACFYAPRGGELDSFQDCAARDPDGTIRLSSGHLRRLDYDRDGLAAIHVGESFLYVRRDGRTAPVMTMDNGADPFVDGRARSPLDGKIGYIDRSLRLVIPRRYDGAMPFEKGVAEVCTGCTRATDGEHSWYAGGRWVRIDRNGRELSAKP
ncbi:WG repeat-containing protein [Sphingomonas sp. R-74633]|uniref:WG repeat-containing protein n=1 Tax=Sphingomonas sp. R-74633 TaxID=2751188 RepID=UPI0015D416D6|nr:WG repeat-containing protein [Sphingomonas sp. R-74633]NYT39587.1 WG repeat-containing protein [Sphingomonas sp. R-74633]